MTRLIDADALKKCAIPCQIHNGALTDLCVPLYQIDNAPTVEYPEAITIKCNTEEDMQKLLSLFRNARVEVRVEAERPQGEWNYIQAGMAVCPFCGATPHKQYKNFCPKCGAKMGKGGAE